MPTRPITGPLPRSPSGGVTGVGGGNPYTVTIGGNFGTASIPSATFHPVISASVDRNIAAPFTFYSVNGHSVYTPNFNPEINGVATTIALSFNTNASVVEFEIQFNRAAGSIARDFYLEIDGVRAPVPEVIVDAGNIVRIARVTVAGETKTRTWRFVSRMQHMSGFYVPPTATVSAPTAAPRFMALGDSYLQGATPFAESFGMNVARRMGHMPIMLPIGGTGYVAANGYTNFVDRLAAVPAGTPAAMVGVFGGINDTSGAAIAANAATLFANIRSRYPSAIIVATGPWCPKGSLATSGKYPGLRDTIQSALAGVAGPWVFMDNLTGVTTTSAAWSTGAGDGPWLTGEGKEDAPVGSGLADLYMSADGTHLNSAGIEWLSGMIYTRLAEAVQHL